MSDRIDFGMTPREYVDVVATAIERDYGPERAAQYRADVEREGRARDRVRVVLRELLAEAGPTVWAWGDGYGGWFMDELVSAIDDVGLARPERPILPPTGARSRDIYERDAYRCQGCGDWHNLTIDHIRPRVKGGTNDPENLQVLCQSCNSRKGTRWAG